MTTGGRGKDVPALARARVFPPRASVRSATRQPWAALRGLRRTTRPDGPPEFVVAADTRAPVSLVIYGATGYTGRLLAARARERGLDVVARRPQPRAAGGDGPPVSGRRGGRSRGAARRFRRRRAGHQLRRPVPADGAAGVAGVSQRRRALSRCRRRRAGIRSAAWLRRGGAPGGKSWRSRAPVSSGGVGLSAAHVAARLPNAKTLWLGFSRADAISRGSLASMLELADGSVTIRRNGRLWRFPREA